MTHLFIFLLCIHFYSSYAVQLATDQTTVSAVTETPKGKSFCKKWYSAQWSLKIHISSDEQSECDDTDQSETWQPPSQNRICRKDLPPCKHKVLKVKCSTCLIPVAVNKLSKHQKVHIVRLEAKQKCQQCKENGIYTAFMRKCDLVKDENLLHQ